MTLSTHQNEDNLNKQIGYASLSDEEKNALALTVHDTAKFGVFFMPEIITRSDCVERIETENGAYSQYHPEINELNKPIIEVLDNTGENKLAMAPRGCGKTTWVSIHMCRMICWRLARFIVYCSNTATTAELQTENLKNLLAHNEIIPKFFGSPKMANTDDAEMRGAVIKEQFSKSAWVAYGSTLILPRGVGQQVRGLLWRGHRPDLFIFDDLENRENVATEEQREKLRNWFFSDAYACVSQYDKNYQRIYIDTLKHEAALLKTLYDDPEWDGVRLEACNDDFNPTAPSFMTKEECIAKYEALRRQGKEDAFFKEYRNLPVARSTQQFRSDDMQLYSNAWERGQAVYNLWTLEYAQSVRNQTKKNFEVASVEQQYAGVIPASDVFNVVIVDPAKTVRTQSAETGFVVVGVAPNHRKLLVHTAQGIKLRPGEIVSHAVDLCEAFNAHILGVEVTSLNLFISDPIETELKNRLLPCKFLKLHAKGQKEFRISALSPWYEMGLFYHQFGKCRELEVQLSSFPASARMDVMDALAYIVPIVTDPKNGLELTSHGKPLNQPETDRYGFPLAKQESKPLEVKFI